MKLQMVGCSHHNAPLEFRERLAFTPSSTAVALERFREQFPQAEAVVVSTCNRVEFYTASDREDPYPSHQQLVEFLAEFHGLDAIELFDQLFERNGEDAARHLFTVACSIDSMVVGEPQILAQVKAAYRLASQQESTGPLTHSAFQAAIRVARRVTTETGIHERRISIPSVAVCDFGRAVFETLADKRVLVVGAGDMARETLRYLLEEGARDITILNRDRQRARSLADEFGGSVAAWDELLTRLVAADVVVSATGAREPIITLRDFQSIEEARNQRPLAILDLAVPRDFEASIGDSLGVYLCCIDDLQATCQRNRQMRDKELPRALSIIEEETRSFMTDLYHRATGPIIRRLREGWQAPKDDELQRLFNKLPDLDDAAREEVRVAFDRLVNKLLHPPLESLRIESRHGIPHSLLDAMRRLFQIRD